MEEPQSFSRTVTPTQSGPAPTTICGSNMKLASSYESGGSEGNGNISLCIMVHGMGGSEADWQTWIEILSQRFPDWVLWPLQKMASACSFMGKELRELSKMAASDLVLIYMIFDYSWYLYEYVCMYIYLYTYMFIYIIVFFLRRHGVKKISLSQMIFLPWSHPPGVGHLGPSVDFVALEPALVGPRWDDWGYPTNSQFGRWPNTYHFALLRAFYGWIDREGCLTHFDGEVE